MDTKDLILKVSKEEFILKGYNNSSLRDIANKCHISATAIYRHFKNKEEIFDAVINPFVNYFNQIINYVEKKDNEFLKKEKVSDIWSFEHDGRFQYKLLFAEYNDLVILLVKERKQWFKDFIINYEFDATIKYINQMKKEGYKIKDFNLISFRVLLDSYLEAYLNLLNKGLEREELFSICNEINEFYTIGFRNLLGF